MIPYSLNVAVLIAISVVFYRTLLQKETFFKLNRAILLGCLILSFIIPLIHVPASFSFRTPVIKTDEAIVYNISPVYEQTTPALQHISKLPPAQNVTNAVPASSLLQTAVSYGLKYIPFIYWAGVIIMGLNLILQLLVLKYQQYKSRSIKDGIFRIVEVGDDRAPCSFANCIYINSEKYDGHTYNQILQHEKIHVLQAHSFDLVLTEVMLMFQWFNPFAWLYRKDIESNLEYLTDDSVLKQNEFDKSDYQMSLVKVSVPNFSMNVTTNYNRSFLKKRILMMNARRSNANRMWKYLTLFLVMGIMVCNFNEPLASAVSKIAHKSAIKEIEPTSITDAEEVEQSAPAAIQPKSNKAIDANTTVPTPAPETTTVNQPATSLKFTDTPGKLSTTFEGARIRVPFPADTVKASAAFVKAIGNLGYASLNQSQMDTLKTAGVTPDFIKAIAALGYEKVPYKMLCVLTLTKVTPTYITSFSNLGYGQIPLSKIPVLKWSDIDVAYIQDFRNVGLYLPLDALSIFKASKITPAFVNDLRNLGYKDASYNQFLMWNSQGITPVYVEDFRKAGLDLPANALSIFKASKITPEYVKDLGELGYKNETYDRFLMWKSQGISADYIKGFNKIGFNNIPVSTLSLLKMSNITPEFIAEMKDKGVVYEDVKRYAFVKKD